MPSALCKGNCIRSPASIGWLEGSMPFRYWWKRSLIHAIFYGGCYATWAKMQRLHIVFYINEYCYRAVKRAGDVFCTITMYSHTGCWVRFWSIQRPKFLGPVWLQVCPFVESLALLGLMPRFKPGWTLGKCGFAGGILFSRFVRTYVLIGWTSIQSYQEDITNVYF